MKLIDELIKKGKLKKGVYSLEMCQKEYTIAQKDLDSAKRVMKIAIISGRRYRHIMLFSMLYARSFLRLDIEKRAMLL